MATEVAKQNPIATLQKGVADRIEQIGMSLPGHITKEKFLRTAQTAIAMTRNIEKAKPGSLLQAVSKAAADGLILDGREAALVIDYNGEAQYRPMMRGLLKLAYNSGMVKSISVQIVHDGDEFEYLLGDEERITHKIDFKAERGEPFAVYAVATLNDGAIMREVMTVAQVNGIRDRSDAYRAFKAGKIKATPWSTDWSEMARKTVFRRLSKYLPSSTDRDTLHQAVERIDDDYTHDIEADDTPAPAPTKKRGGAAAALKNVTPYKPLSRDDIGKHDDQLGRKVTEADIEPQHEDATDFDAETGEVRERFPDGMGDGQTVDDDI